MKELISLYWAFFRIGGLTFGGGLTMLPMLKYELVEKNGWVTEEELIDCYAIGQCTPGIIAVNTATFVGYKKRGVIGGIISTLGMISPSIVIITLIALCLEQFMDNVWAMTRTDGGTRCGMCTDAQYGGNIGKKEPCFACLLCDLYCRIFSIHVYGSSADCHCTCIGCFRNYTGNKEKGGKS